MTSGWRKVPFGEIVQTVSVRGHQIKSGDYASSGPYPVIDQGQKKIVGYTDVSIPIKGPFPLTLFGDHTRIVKLITFPFVVGADGVKLLYPSETDVDPNYLFFLTEHIAQNIPNLGYSRHFKELRKIIVVVPPLSEQRKVARILSTWDQAIETVEKLIAGSQAQTKALIQQLIRQNRRLQGFEGNWNAITLGQICQVTTGQPAPKNSNDFSTRGIPFLRVNALESLLAGSSEDDFEKISSKTAEHYRLSLFPEGTVIFAKSGMSSKLGRVYQLRKSCYLVSHYAAVLPNSETSSDFLVCWLEINPPSSLIQGEGFPSIKISEIKKMKLELTSLAEQKAIVSVINCAKAEVQVWTRELKQLSDQKKVLMQQVLTGKRRVVMGNTID